MLELYEQKSAPKRTQRRADRRELVVDTMTAPVAEGGPDLIEWTVMSMGAGAVTGGLVFGFLAEGRASESEASAVNWPLKKPKTWPRLPMSFTGSVVLVSRPVLHFGISATTPHPTLRLRRC